MDHRLLTHRKLTSLIFRFVAVKAIERAAHMLDLIDEKWPALEKPVAKETAIKIEITLTARATNERPIEEKVFQIDHLSRLSDRMMF